MKKDGFTLIEVLVVMAILGMMAVILVGILNPIALTGRGYDARRKKDLGRIKVAFEEYYNDKGCYPTEGISATLRLKSSCGSKTIFSPWLASWPCDPNGEPYYVFVESNTTCPRWFKLITNLENKKDMDIPSGWYEQGNYYVGDGTLGINQANYGTSSTNVLWYDRAVLAGCGRSGGGCYYLARGNVCNALGQSCRGGNCFLSYTDIWGGTNNCAPFCQVDCCENGLVCNE